MALPTELSGCHKKQCEEKTLVTLVIKSGTVDYSHHTRSDPVPASITFCMGVRNVKKQHHITSNGENKVCLYAFLQTDIKGMDE